MLFRWSLHKLPQFTAFKCSAFKQDFKPHVYYRLLTLMLILQGFSMAHWPWQLYCMESLHPPEHPVELRYSGMWQRNCTKVPKWLQHSLLINLFINRLRYQLSASLPSISDSWLMMAKESQHGATSCTSALETAGLKRRPFWGITFSIPWFYIFHSCIMIKLLQCKPINPHTALEFQ